MTPLYHNQKTQQIDQIAAQALAVDSYGLMQLAGAAIFSHLKSYPKLLILTGPGNNGGDGFVVAELARQNGQQVTLLALRPVTELSGDALTAAKAYQGEVKGGSCLPQISETEYDVVVDAIFGTGLESELLDPYQQVIKWINQQTKPVVAVDIPSGLNGSTGAVMGCAVTADQTIAVLALNTGLHTLDGKDHCGEVVLADLGVDSAVFSGLEPNGWLLTEAVIQDLSSHRLHNSHKGSMGHVLAVGGQSGMLGAVLLAGQAALKSGTGAVTVVTDPGHADYLPLAAPELMTHGFDAVACVGLESLAARKPIDVLLLGMGLGQSQWSKQLYKASTQLAKPLVVDADGLTLLSRSPVIPADLAVITPHPKEAAMLLQSSVSEVQADRWSAVKLLAKQYRCVAVLKGAGTLISNGQQVWCCPFGSANLATAGAGDVLAGMVAGIMAQGVPTIKATQMAVVWHAIAGERSRYGQTLTASELLATLHEYLA